MTGVVLLAAGASTRLGQPKLQLLYKGQTLVQLSLEAALQSVCKPIIVVQGAIGLNLSETSLNNEVSIVNNDQWQKGMGSSINAGMKAVLSKEPNINSVIIMLCDQPYVDSTLLDLLVKKKQETGEKIIACSYKNTLGVPVLFDGFFFDQLLQLNDEEGAKKILFKHPNSIASIPFPEGEIDIDTMEDYKRLG